MDETTKLYRIYKTCLEMLHDRKYVVLEVWVRPGRAAAVHYPRPRPALTSLPPKPSVVR